MRHLILVGAGHAHLLVLKHLADHPQPKLQVTLITPNQWQYYSGMLPGWVAKLYKLSECRVNASQLAENARAAYIEDYVTDIDAIAKQVITQSGLQLHFDVLSIDIGSDSKLDDLASLEGLLLPIKPLEKFAPSWLEFTQQVKESTAPTNVAVIGGGAAGVEIAMAVARALELITSTKADTVTLFTGKNRLLNSHAHSVQQLAKKQLERLNIRVVQQRVLANNDKLLLENGQQLKFDAVIATTGSQAPIWLQRTRLALDENGYVLVDSFHRSISHPYIFAVGDVSSRIDRNLTKSGVHAVKVSKILIFNLFSVLNNSHSLKSYCPRPWSLYLLSCSNELAILSYGKVGVQGRWVWQLKNKIDRQFIKNFEYATKDDEQC